MSPDEKFRSIALATRLGPVVPFFGIAGNWCECARPVTKQHSQKNFGKHPRASKGWKATATGDHEIIAAKLQDWPFTNFGLLIPEHLVVVDLDIRPEKNGIEFLTQHGELPRTVMVESGGGGLHLYFKRPPTKVKGIGPKGVDVKQNGAILVPGSMHLSGNFYRWFPGLSPLDIELAEMPEWMVSLLSQNASGKQYGAPGSIEESGGMERPSGAIKAGKLRPDSWVVRNWRKYVRTGSSDGHRSDQDIYNASSLAMWTSHNWEQYLRIWFGSPVWSGKKYAPGVEMKSILIPAFVNQRANFKPKPRPKRTRRSLEHTANPALAKAMRQAEDLARKRPVSPRSQNSKAVLELHREQPSLTAADIAKTLGLDYHTAYRILKRYTLNTKL